MDIAMIDIECCKCNITFAITKDAYERLRRCHNIFYCPNGHAQNFPAKSELDIARERANDLAAKLAAKQAELQEALKPKRKPRRKAK